ncbi:hypothetical protein K2173_008067 [Erythroxylum novogranatense]|uniref:AT-hook motif nuclear-localized protein n=1 Tax=Erythroxylum novogranatense TaxID=1862640 RepID=A0AAV8T7P7_9ROSI|nr:hypothetical protein K2173_008067 [Erythroxylum novogranatense]
MKGEFVEPQLHHHPKHETPNMFSKLSHHQHQHQHQHLPFSQHFQLSRDSEDDDTRSTAAATTANTTPTTATPNKHHRPNEQPNSSVATDGATIEVVRRPRGRPPGSKNKPKPPVIITREPEPAMSPYILEVPGGSDIVEAISRFCHRKNIGICVLTASGTVANVTLRQPSTTPGAVVTFHGRFDILSISATFLPQPTSYPVPNTFTISLAGPQGQIVGGIVAGSLVAAGTVFIIAASFNSPSFHRLPIDGQSPAVSGQGGGGGDSGHVASGGEMYSCHLPSDVIWAPTARPPPPY